MQSRMRNGGIAQDGTAGGRRRRPRLAGGPRRVGAGRPHRQRATRRSRSRSATSPRRWSRSTPRHGHLRQPDPGQAGPGRRRRRPAALAGERHRAHRRHAAAAVGHQAAGAGASVDETFAQSCLTCSITYTYRMESGTALTGPLTDAVTEAAAAAAAAHAVRGEHPGPAAEPALGQPAAAARGQRAGAQRPGADRAPRRTGRRPAGGTTPSPRRPRRPPAAVPSVGGSHLQLRRPRPVRPSWPPPVTPAPRSTRPGSPSPAGGPGGSGAGAAAAAAVASPGSYDGANVPDVRPAGRAGQPARRRAATTSRSASDAAALPAAGLERARADGRHRPGRQLHRPGPGPAGAAALIAGRW